MSAEHGCDGHDCPECGTGTYAHQPLTYLQRLAIEAIQRDEPMMYRVHLVGAKVDGVGAVMCHFENCDMGSRDKAMSIEVRETSKPERMFEIVGLPDLVLQEYAGSGHATGHYTPVKESVLRELVEKGREALGMYTSYLVPRVSTVLMLDKANAENARLRGWLEKIKDHNGRVLEPSYMAKRALDGEEVPR